MIIKRKLPMKDNKIIYAVEDRQLLSMFSFPAKGFRQNGMFTIRWPVSSLSFQPQSWCLTPCITWSQDSRVTVTLRFSRFYSHLMRLGVKSPQTF